MFFRWKVQESDTLGSGLNKQHSQFQISVCSFLATLILDIKIKPSKKIARKITDVPMWRTFQRNIIMEKMLTVECDGEEMSVENVKGVKDKDDIHF